MSGTHTTTLIRSCPKCSHGLLQGGGCKPGHREPACPPAASACKDDQCHQADPHRGSETLPKCALPAASSRLYGQDSSSADVQDSAVSRTRRNFQNKPSGKENSKLFPCSAAPPRLASLVSKSQGRVWEDRERAPKAGAEGARQ